MRTTLSLFAALACGSCLLAGPCLGAEQAPAAGHLGILAYGSLIDDPGEEIGGATSQRTAMKTPFAIEFGRSSHTRGAPPLWCR